MGPGVKWKEARARTSAQPHDAALLNSVWPELMLRCVSCREHCGRLPQREWAACANSFPDSARWPGDSPAVCWRFGQGPITPAAPLVPPGVSPVSLPPAADAAAADRLQQPGCLPSHSLP